MLEWVTWKPACVAKKKRKKNKLKIQAYEIENGIITRANSCICAAFFFKPEESPYPILLRN